MKKEITQSKLVFVKLVTGEELIAQFESEDEDILTVFEPVEFKRMWNNDNTTVIGASNFLLFLNNYHMPISKCDIIHSSDAIAPQVQLFYDAFMEQNPQSARNIFKVKNPEEYTTKEFIEEVELDEKDMKTLLRAWCPVSNTAPH